MLTPRLIVEELNRYIVGQEGAKKAVAVALCNRERRHKLDPSMRREVMPKNIIMIGPTGVGKTEIARRIATLVNAPFLKVEATKFTEVGYVGRDVDSIISELVETTAMNAYEGRLQEVQIRAESLATERLADYIFQQLDEGEQPTENPGRMTANRARKRGQRALATPRSLANVRGRDADNRRSKQMVVNLIKDKQLDDRVIEIEVNDGMENVLPCGELLVNPDMTDWKEEFTDAGTISRTCNAQRLRRKVSVREARSILTHEEASKLIDLNQLMDQALHNVEDHAVIFIDELDKLVGPRIDAGRDVSGEGVQRDLLPLIEGSTVGTRYGPVKTDHVLFVAAGCFYHSKPSDLIPELQGRFPLRVELSALTDNDLEKILTGPDNALTKQYQALLATEGVRLNFTEDGIREITRLAALMNRRSDNIGARRLNTIMERILEDINFTAPEKADETVTVDASYVSDHIGSLIKEEDLSRYIL